MWVLGPVGVSGREVLGPLFRVQALNALIDFAVFLVYHINLLIDLGFVGGSFGQLSSPPRTFSLAAKFPLIVWAGPCDDCLGLSVLVSLPSTFRVHKYCK